MLVVESILIDLRNIVTFTSVLNTLKGEQEGKDGVSLKSITLLTDEAEKDAKAKVKRSTSVKYEEIKNAYTRSELELDLQELNREYKSNVDVNDNIQILGPSTKDSKGDLITKIILLRKLMISHDSKWKRRTEVAVKESLEEAEENTDITQSLQKSCRIHFIIYNMDQRQYKQKSFTVLIHQRQIRQEQMQMITMITKLKMLLTMMIII